ncbi:hypothetical protein TNCV_3022921 [Trichonephila clavipes]|nr:hypothetical protein TNCV_3022921 [Trichonephila clavipes]
MINEGHTSKHVDSNWSTGIFVMMLSKMSAVSELFQRSCFRQSEIVRLLNVPRQTMSSMQSAVSKSLQCWSKSSTSAIVEHLQYPMSVMFWGGICTSGKTPLAFVKEGVKISQKSVPGGHS